MKISIQIITIVLLVTLFGCEKEALISVNSTDNAEFFTRDKNNKASKATGTVEVVYYAKMGSDEDHGEGHGENPGNMGGNEIPGNLKRAIVEFDAIDGDNVMKEDKGNISIEMVTDEYVIKRKMLAEVDFVYILPEQMMAVFSGIVYHDERYNENHFDHEGGNCGGHDESESGEDHGENGGPPTRVGNRIAMLVQDLGTPGTNGDFMGWKWMHNNNENDFFQDFNGENLNVEMFCEKTIVGGNINVLIK